MESSNRTVMLHPSIALVCSPETHCDPKACGADTILASAFARAKPRLSPKTALPQRASEAVLHRLVVCITTTAAAAAAAAAAGGGEGRPLPGPAMDESYALHVPSGDANGAANGADNGGANDGAGAEGDVTIEAGSVFGSLLALQSLQQLVAFTTPGRITAAPVTIVDAPEYRTRGLMVNPSIRFMPIAFLERVVDGLALNKMNYLHIHFTDVSSLPVEKSPLATNNLLERVH